VLYAYKNEQEIIERDFPMGRAPPIINENGKEYRRYWGSMTVIYGSSFHNEGQIKFKRGPIESNAEYT
jgi:hypothetical protein